MNIFKEISDAIQEGLNSIFERWDLILWQIAATIILIIIVRIFLWKPITRYLEKRQEALSKELYEAAHERERVTQIRYELQTEYEEMRKEARQMKDSLIYEAQQEKDRIITEARNEAKRRIQQVDRDIQQELKIQSDKIKERIKEIAFDVAEKIVTHDVTEENIDETIEEMIDTKL
ncbi:ATP synthase F0 subunit B [Acholeplasma granularum]|uniref:F0F1 ATP synthase subunit B family protein n=1 Tax=Acholeplasma granularum TaxID=264635 RepID=UPI0004B168AE|nr:ATP synthase F0 subunit B [Acholeplasma granularum]